MYQLTVDTPLGSILLKASGVGLTDLCLASGHSSSDASPILTEAARQLSAYFDGSLRDFDVKVDMSNGTAFQQRVWTAVACIPYGHTASYLDVARIVSNDAAVRAVGTANGRNPLPIIIPCHRVIGSDGSLTGYRYGIDIKRQLLMIEDPDRWGQVQGQLWSMS